MKPRAVILSPAPNQRAGGVEQHCGLVGNLLRRRGWEVSEVGPTADPGVWMRRLGLTPLLQSRSTVRAILEPDPDLVISNGTLGAWGAPRPRIHVYHGTMVDHVRLGERNLPRREFVRRIASYGLTEALGGRGATLVAVSERAAAEVARYYRLTVDEVIPTAVDLTEFFPRDRAQARERLGLPADARLALYVGRLEHRKGSDLLLPACDAAGLELMVAGPSAPERGRHLGGMSHAELSWAYAAADCLLFPSRYEGFSFVLLEALACELPVVTTPTGSGESLARAVDGYDRFVVAPRVDALTDALRGLVEDDRERLVARAARWVREEYSLDVFDARWAALVERVVPDAAARAAARD